MESFVCHIGNCSNPGLEYCETCDQVICRFHSHLLMESHKTFTINKPLTSSEKSQISQIASWAIQKSSNLRKDVLKSSKILIDQINQEATSLISKLDNIISQAYLLNITASKLDSILLYKNPNKDQEILIKYIKEGQNFDLFLELENFRAPLIEKVLEDKLRDFIRSTPTQISLYKMVFFKHDSKTMNVYNIKTNKIEKKETEVVMGDRAGWCFLPDGSVFHCGGRIAKENTDFACIINPEKLAVKSVKKCTKMRNLGQVTYSKGEVYVFGGFNKGVSLGTAFKYNLLKNNWTDIANLPMPSEHCSSCCYGKSIMVTGRELDGIYDYSRKSNVYRLRAQLTKGYKTIFSAFGRCYCLCNNSVIETNFMETTTWISYIERSVVVEQKRLLAPTLRRGSCVYLLYENLHLYMFNLETRKVSLLKVIPSF